MHTHDQDSDGKSISIMDFYGSDSTPILGMVHDMIKAYAHAHSIITRLLHVMVEGLQNGTQTIPEILILLQAVVLPECTNGGFPNIAASVEHILHDMKLNLISINEFNNKLAYIRNRAMEEGEKLMLFPVAPDGIEKYNNPLLFGSDVKDSFPDANQDIVESGNCYALGQPTACILHLMRALESSLKTFAQNMHGFTLEPKDTMGKIVVKLQKLAHHLPDGTFDEIKLKNKIHKSALHFHDITEAIRNEAMHTGAFYSMEEANMALVSAKLFLNDLASVIKPPGVPNATATKTP